MQFLIVVRDEKGDLIFTPGTAKEVSGFCSLNRSQMKSECAKYYNNLFDKYDSENNRIRGYSRCPYGLQSIGPIDWSEKARIASGFLIDKGSIETIPDDVVRNASTTKDAVEGYLATFDSVAREFYLHSYGYLESAIHDVRHLNQAITSHAERLLKAFGYDPNQEWDMKKLYESEADKRALSIYCASRDMSSALSMHEIAIDPSRASDERILHQIHKLFYRQKQISMEKIIDKNLSLTIGNTTKSILLTKSFSLIPMILLNNAIKYAERNSTIKLEFVEAGSIFRIVCTNSGPVLRQDELEKVFNKYWRGSNRSGIPGHGIGLWLANLIVKANLGAIDMRAVEKSRDMAGRKVGDTIVTIKLP